jgi:hypothetical protein
MENTDLFQEDASLPAQYWDTFARKRELEPEKTAAAGRPR